ncbi:MAG: phospho-N-acetylmuramoyl-pentapeptide-transferase [Candidatus Melainabacteria bacterium]|jgi:phospho-N-acetylmuramoyl-pentapeptide-transferase
MDFNLPLFSLSPFILSFALAYFLVAVSGKVLIQTLQQIGFIQFIREEGPASHRSKQSTPTAGGLIFPLTLVIPPILYFLWFVVFEDHLESDFPWNKTILFPIVVIISAFIGFLDDYLKKVKKQNEGLKPKQKLLGQIILAAILGFSLHRTETSIFGLNLELGLILFLVFVFFVFAGSMNAANLTDGLDGLASSVLGWSYLGLGLLVFLKNGSFYSILCSFSMAGACFGFLWINGHPAKAFMGDSGSFLLGGGLAAIALIEGLEWYLLILALIPIWETLSVILQVASCKLSKKYLGKDIRLFKMTPFHHHLELSGWGEKKIVWILASSQFLINLILLIYSLK